MPQVTLLPGPRLLRVVYPDDGPPQDEDVTERAVEFLFDRLVLGPDLRLRDLLGLFERCPALLPVYGRFYAKELGAEAALGPLPEAERSELQFLELRQFWEYDSHSREYSGLWRLDISGVGLPSEDMGPSWIEADGLTRYSLLGANIRPMLDLPLRLKTEVAVTEADEHSVRHSRPLSRVRCADLILGAVLQAVLWEMTWFGPPDEAEETIEEMVEEFAELDAKPQAWREMDYDSYMESVFGGSSQLACETLFESIGRFSVQQVVAEIQRIPDRYNGRQWLARNLGKPARLRPAYRRLNGRDLRAAFSEARHRPGE